MKVRSIDRRSTRWTVTCLALAGLALGALGCMTPAPNQSEPNEQEKKAISARAVGIDHLSKGRVAMSLRELTLAASLDPADSQTQLWLGEAYRRKAKFEEAETHMLRAIELSPDFYLARVNLTGLYLQLERYEDAIRVCDVLVDDPFFAQPWTALNNRGWAQYKLGRLREARQSYEDAIDFRREFWPAHLNLGILSRDEGHTLEAIKHFEAVTALDLGFSPDAEANFRLGEIYVGMGRRETAVRHFADAVKVAPYDTWGERSKSYLELLR